MYLIRAGAAVSAVIRQDADRVAHIWLNRPEKRNALNDEMFEQLVAEAESLRDDEDVTAVVLSGRGASFCAGLDFSVHADFAAEADAGQRPFADPDNPSSDGKRRPGRGQRVVRALRDAPAVVIAAIHGHAIGGGLQLALGADIRLVTPDARLGLAEINFGLTADMGATQLLPRLVGSDRALELLTTGVLISGEEAAAWGLATRVCGDPRAEAVELAARIAAMSPSAVRATKRLVRLSDSVPVADGMHEELRVMSRNIGSPEQTAATHAYFARRAAR
jgi:enoyl-CoA hydratase/carnithine racemase